MENNDTKTHQEDQFFSMVTEEGNFTTKTNKMYSQRKPYVPENPALIKSFMPGNIPEVFVKEGEDVVEGQILLILEAMKMKNKIMAPFDGKIKAINVKVGDKVPKNFALIEMEN